MFLNIFVEIRVNVEIQSVFSWEIQGSVCKLLLRLKNKLNIVIMMAVSYI